MRRDHRPIAWQRLARRISQWYIRHFLRPQLDECGEGLEIVGPQYVSFSGANILLGRHVHMMALSDAPIRLAVFEGMGRVEVAIMSSSTRALGLFRHRL